MPLRVFVSLALALALVGCGYSLVRYPKRGEALAVAVQTFQNKSYDPGFEILVSDALRRELARRGALRLVNNPGVASYILSGTIQSIDTGRRSFSSVVGTLEFEVQVALEVELSRPGTEITVDNRVLRESEAYLASADIEVTRKNREEALRHVAGVMATRIHDVIWEVAPP